MKTKAAAWLVACPWLMVLPMVVALATSASPQASQEQEIPFEKSHIFGLILIKVEVNGKPAVLIVDTGANQTMISSELVHVRSRGLENTVSTSKGSGWTGNGVFATATLRVGPITWNQHRIVVMEMHELSKTLGQEIDGLLGADFLCDFERVVIDSKRHKIIFIR